MSRILNIGWTRTGHKPHLPQTLWALTSRCGRPLVTLERQKVELSDVDPVGGICVKCWRAYN